MVCSCGDLSYWLSPPQGVGQGCGSFQHKVTDVPRLSVCQCDTSGLGLRSVTEMSRTVTSLLLLISHLLLPTCVSQCQVNMVARCTCRFAMCFQGGAWQPLSALPPALYVIMKPDTNKADEAGGIIAQTVMQCFDFGFQGFHGCSPVYILTNQLQKVFIFKNCKGIYSVHMQKRIGRRIGQ